MGGTKEKSYAQKQMELLKVTEENNMEKYIYDPETFERQEREITAKKFQRFREVTPDLMKHELKGARGVQVGDLMIAYFDLYGQIFTYKPLSRKTKKDYVMTRLQTPIMVDGRMKKYHQPFQADTTRPYVTRGIIEKYNAARKWKLERYKNKDKPGSKENPGKIKTLILTEGAKKAWYADLHGMDIMAFNSITHYKNKVQGKMHSEVLEVIDACDVENFIMLYDGDATNISMDTWSENGDISKRPMNFFRSMRSIKNLLRDVIEERGDNFKIFFSMVKSKEIEGEPKGLDDLLQAFPDEATQIVESATKIDKKTPYFEQIEVTYNLTKLQNFMGLKDAESFAEYHSEIIMQRPFTFMGTNYRWDDGMDGNGKWKIEVPADAKRYVRISDKYYEKIKRPDINGTLTDQLEPRMKTTITDDHSPKILKHIDKYPSFAIIPSHDNYQQVVHNCYNLYHPFEHEPLEGATDEDCATILSIFDHIFGDLVEIGLDYVQILYQHPTENLPILMLVSEEQGTGKSTFFFFLVDLFTNNMAVVGNEDLANDFNGHWTSKLIVGCEETFIDKKSVVEKVKGLSTGRKIMMNRKGQDQQQVDAFMKFVFCSNNEKNILAMNENDTRYMVIKVNRFKGEEIHDLPEQLRLEIPAFLSFLERRKITVEKESRMWFKPERFKTSAFEKIVENSIPQVVKEFKLNMKDLFELSGDREILMDLKVITEEFFKKGRKENHYVKDQIQKHGKAEYYTQWFADGKWYENEHEVPEGLEAKRISKSINFSYPKIDFTDTSQDSEASKEYTVKYVRKKGRPWIFRAENFLNEDEMIAVFGSLSEKEQRAKDLIESEQEQEPPY